MFFQLRQIIVTDVLADTIGNFDAIFLLQQRQKCAILLHFLTEIRNSIALLDYILAGLSRKS
jgi:hypothetical protein